MAPSANSTGWSPQEAPDSSALFSLVTVECRSQVQGQCMCPWELIFACLSFKVFLYKDGLGLVLPCSQYPLQFCWNRRNMANAFQVHL